MPYKSNFCEIMFMLSNFFEIFHKVCPRIDFDLVFFHILQNLLEVCYLL